jgi:hypothetical protein
MNSTSSEKPPDYLGGILSSLREKIAQNLLDEMSQLLFKIHHPDSGRVIESVVQMLSDNKLTILAALCTNSQDSESIQVIATTIIMRLASKQNIEITSTEMFVDATNNFLLLVNFENLRRRGYLEYLWQRDMFSTAEDPMAFNKITPEGAVYTQQEFLKRYEGTGKTVQ